MPAPAAWATSSRIELVTATARQLEELPISGAERREPGRHQIVERARELEIGERSLDRPFAGVPLVDQSLVPELAGELEHEVGIPVGGLGHARAQDSGHRFGVHGVGEKIDHRIGGEARQGDS
jgi:hypothetical protein